MLQQIQEHPVSFAIMIIVAVIFVAMYLFARKLRGNTSSSDNASIMQCSFIPSAAGFFPGTITRMSDGMAMPAGTLRMTVGTAPFKEVPESVDVKLLFVDEGKNVFEASKRLPVRRDGMIGVIDVPFPLKPYDGELICKAWVVAAYYRDGNSWINNNASKYEDRNKRFVANKLSKIN